MGCSECVREESAVGAEVAGAPGVMQARVAVPAEGGRDVLAAGSEAD